MKGTVFIAVIFKNMQQLQNDAENITALGFDFFMHRWILKAGQKWFSGKLNLF